MVCEQRGQELFRNCFVLVFFPLSGGIIEIEIIAWEKVQESFRLMLQY